MVVPILAPTEVARQQSLQLHSPRPISRMVDNPRDSKKIRLVVIVVLALIVAYLLYSAL
jgi:hypothetical protein